MKPLLVIVSALLTGLPPLTASADACLVVSDQDFAIEKASFIGLEVQWSAAITNQCDQPMDAALTIHFEDADGKSLYEVSDWATLQAREMKQLGKQVYLPSRLEYRIDRLAIVSEESDRPL